MCENCNNCENNQPPTRRSLLGWMVGIINLAVVAAVAGPVLGFVTSPLRRRAKKQWVGVLPDRELARGETREGRLAGRVLDGSSRKEHEYTVYLRRDTDKVVAFDPACTHLGCRVQYQGDKKRYLCPCHGGVFADDGAVVSGPPPKPLDQHPVRIENGQIQVSWRT